VMAYGTQVPYRRGFKVCAGGASYGGSCWSKTPVELRSELILLVVGTVDKADERPARQLDHPALCGTCCASFLVALRWF